MSPGAARVAVKKAADRAGGWLREASRSALANGTHVADEGDRWFVSAVRTLDGGAQRAERGIDAVVGALFTQLGRLRPRWIQNRTPRERIEALLQKEARRFHFDVDQQAFRAFAEKIAILLELVFTGAVRLDDVAFEGAGEPASPPPPAAPPSAQSGEEVTEAEKRDEGDDGQPVEGQQDAAR